MKKSIKLVAALLCLFNSTATKADSWVVGQIPPAITAEQELIKRLRVGGRDINDLLTEEHHRARNYVHKINFGHVIVPSGEKISLNAFMKHEKMSSGIKNQLFIEPKFDVYTDSQITALGIIIDACNIVKIGDEIKSRNDKGVIQAWKSLYGNFIKFEGTFFNPSEEDSRSYEHHYTRLDHYNEYPRANRYKKFYNEDIVYDCALYDVRIPIVDFRCVIDEERHCRIPSNNSLGRSVSTLVIGEPFTRAEFVKKIKSLDLYPGDVVSIDGVLRRARGDGKNGILSLLEVNAFDIKIYAEEKFTVAGDKILQVN